MDLGSMDLISLLQRLHAKKQRSNEERTLVQILALVLVLSRIMTLEHCLDVAQRERNTFTCKHWMLLQVGFSSMGILDLFANLSGSIANKIQRHSMDIWTMSAIVQNRFSKLQQRLKDGATLPPKILLVIDEAQNLAFEEYGVFDSQFLDDDAATDNKHSRPILSPLLHGLYLIAHDHNMFSVIPCGTGLSMIDMKWLEDSDPAAKGHGKARFTDFRAGNHLNKSMIIVVVCETRYPISGPGPFSTLKYQTHLERMIESDSGEINWELAIEETVNNLTLPELDVKGSVCYDLQNMISKVVKFPWRYREYQSIRATLKKFVVQHYLFGSPLPLNKEEVQLIEASVGRIPGIGAKKKTVLDEPFVLLAAKNYFQEYDKNFHRELCVWFSASRKPFVHGHIWKPAMLPSLVNAFNGKILSKTPLVPVGKSQDLILDMEARIVGYEGHTTLGVDHMSMPSLDTFLTAHVDGNSLFDGNEVAPFYLPSERTPGPDIVFVLRFRDNEGRDLGCCPVFVKSKLRSNMLGGETRDAFSTVKSDAVGRLLEEKLEKYCTVSPKRFFGVVVAYPAKLAGSEGLFPTISRIAGDLSAQAKGEKLGCISLRIDRTNINGLFLKRHMRALTILKGCEHDFNSSSSRSGSIQNSDEEPATKRRRLDDVN
ncbi:hypothetical protein BGZ83_000989 [Gryganskiella cystojenkinii]|nr:hypothetical protein BGZ83_000989 [Gryganskiella cystojenkinii]